MHIDVSEAICYLMFYLVNVVLKNCCTKNNPWTITQPQGPFTVSIPTFITNIAYKCRLAGNT